MQVEDYFAFATITAAVCAVLGWWIKTRLDSSIKHEYDRVLETLKTEQRRGDVLQAERLKAFRALSSKLVVLIRYCEARQAEAASSSEFHPRTDSLLPEENRSLLQHNESLRRELDEYELFISPRSRAAFNCLFEQVSLGCNLEQLLVGRSDLELNPELLYRLVGERINDVRTALYEDLGLPDLALKSSRLPAADRGLPLR